jgi:CpXC motif protein
MPRAVEPFGGAWGRTRTESIHYSCPCGYLFAADVHRSVSATRDPALANRLIDGTLSHVTCPSCGQVSRVDVPVVYHDEAKHKLILVLPPSLRHRELEERAEMLLALARDKGHAIPAYVRDFMVVFGGEELGRAVRPGAPGPATTAPLPTLQVPPAAGAGSSSGLSEKALFGDSPVHTVIDDSTSRNVAFAGESERPRPGLTRDAAVLRWRDARTPAGFQVEHGDVRLFFRAGGRLPMGTLAVRVQLHRMPTYPLLVVALLTGDEAAEPYALPFDLGRHDDRSALDILAATFHLVVDFFDDAYEPVARREVILPLAANVRYALAVAEEELQQIPAPRRSYEAAVAAWRAPGFDRYGRRDPRLEEDSFALLPSASAAQKALAVVAAWSEPDNEDYLLLVRSFPIEQWRRIRARVITRSVDLGLVLPGVLATVAVSDGLYRDRQELTTRTLSAFADLLAARDKAMDLDPDDVAANWRALLIMCEEEGIAIDARVADMARTARPSVVVVQPRERDREPAALVRPAAGGRSPREETGRIAVPIDAGTASRLNVVPDMKTAKAGALIEMLDDQDARLGAALELCRRVEATAVGPVFGALRRMARGEAVRVLPAVIRFGDRAVPHLVDGLRSRKAYLRQGCALALGILKSGDGIDPLCELLVTEPTEVWKEIARAIGEIGGGAVMSLAAKLRDPATAEGDARERIAWALAHLVARGSRGPVEALASGRDAAAAGAARRALEMSLHARDNDAEVRGPMAPHDQTVNRAFSRLFFEAMGVPDLDGRMPLEEELDSAEVLLEDEDILQS